MNVPHMRAFTVDADNEAEATAQIREVAGTSPATELTPQWDSVSMSDAVFVVTEQFDKFFYACCGKAWETDVKTTECPSCHMTIEPYHKE